MRNQAQKGFRGIYFGIPQHQKGYLVYVSCTRKILSSYNVVLGEIFQVFWNIRRNHMQKRWLYIRLCNKKIMIHSQGNEMTI